MENSSVKCKVGTLGLIPRTHVKHMGVVVCNYPGDEEAASGRFLGPVGQVA